MKCQSLSTLVDILVDMVNTPGIEGTGPANEAMDFVILRQEQFRQIRTILSGNSCDQSAFRCGSQDDSNSLSFLFSRVVLQRSYYQMFVLNMIMNGALSNFWGYT